MWGHLLVTRVSIQLMPTVCQSQRELWACLGGGGGHDITMNSCCFLSAYCVTRQCWDFTWTISVLTFHPADGETAPSSQPLPSLLENVGGSYFRLGTIMEGLPERGDMGL